MCGFLGKVSFYDFNEDELLNANQSIVCRGPDCTKSISSADGDLNYSFWFNRLSILDLSEDADQPMVSKDSNNILMFNGEIYNHRSLRKDLEKRGLTFYTSHSDTEVILNGISEFGITFINKLRGQFSIFYLDKKLKKILLIRDRVGQKPLYYRIEKDSLIFGSNLLAITKLDSNLNIDFEEVNHYLNYGVISSPHTPFEKFKKILPAQIVEINYSNSELESKEISFWKLEDHIDNKQFNEEEFFDIFSESIKIRTLADVPVGNFLSGGLDSSSIVKNLSDAGSEVNSFSVNIDNPKYDESRWSQLVADKYKTNHRSVDITSNITQNDINQSLDSLDEPYSDPSVVPSYILSKEISNHFKVAISGDGGDELLGGYFRTHATLRNKSSLSNVVSKLYNLYPPSFGTGNFFLSKSKDHNVVYKSFLEDNNLLNLIGIDRNSINNYIHINNDIDLYKALLIADYKFYLPEMMMFKVDRTSMANSLEVRSPFVDHLLIEYILSHSTEYLETSSPKKLLKKYMLKDMGVDFVNRKKKGFIFDLENWVYKNINFIEQYLLEGKIINAYSKNPLKVLKINKSRINSNRIWKLFVLEYYFSKF